MGNVVCWNCDCLQQNASALLTYGKLFGFPKRCALPLSLLPLSHCLPSFSPLIFFFFKSVIVFVLQSSIKCFFFKGFFLICCFAFLLAKFCTRFVEGKRGCSLFSQTANCAAQFSPSTGENKRRSMRFCTCHLLFIEANRCFSPPSSPPNSRRSLSLFKWFDLWESVPLRLFVTHFLSCASVPNFWVFFFVVCALPFVSLSAQHLPSETLNSP
jgi:hypothetical protein